MIKLLLWGIDDDFKILGQSPSRYMKDVCEELEVLPDIRSRFVSGPFGESIAHELKDMEDDDKLLLIKDSVPLLKAGSLYGFIKESFYNDEKLSFLVAHEDEVSELMGEFSSKFTKLTLIGVDMLKKVLAGIENKKFSPEELDKAMGEACQDINLHVIDDFEELLILKSNVDRAHIENEIRDRINIKLMESGVIMENPESIHIEPDVEIGEGTLIEANVRITGDTFIGENCLIGMNSNISDSKIGNGVKIYSSFIEKSLVEDYTDIGPFARLRPNSHLMEKVHIGNFVEVKNSTVGSGTKAGHLAYIGDSDLGKGINIGCGVIFVNYDGKNKHRSTVEDGAFIGSNANIVAPVHIAKEGYVAAGSTITKDVGEGQLAIERAKQKNIDGYVEMKKERDKNK